MRVWSLDINGQPFISSQIGNRQFRIQFNVMISPGQSISSADISIYNLAKTTNIPQKSSIVLRAGYDDNSDIIFSGYVTNAFREREYTEIRTRLLCTSGGANNDRGAAGGSYGKNAKITDVLTDLARSWPAQLDIDEAQFSDSPLLTSGFVSNGDIPDTLNKLGYQYDFEWVIERGRMIISRRNRPRRSAIVQVDQFNGMVGIPEVSLVGVFVATTLNPSLRSNSRINITSEFQTFNTGNAFIQERTVDIRASGEYNVFSLTHKGDNYSDQWVTEIDALRVVETPAAAKPTASATPSAIETGGSLIWGKRVDQAFRVKVREIAADLKYDPNWLMAIMAFETGYSFSPQQKNNAGGSATGLIQFTPIAAKQLNTTMDRIRRMSAVQQLDLVRDYFKSIEKFTGRPKNLGDCYMMVLWPRAVGKPDSYVMWEKDFPPYQKQYNANSGLDKNNDGKITRGEAVVRVNEATAEGKKKAF